MGQTQEESNRFKHGYASVEGETRAGRPPTGQNADVIEKVRRMVVKRPSCNNQEIVLELGIGAGSVLSFLTEDLVHAENVGETGPQSAGGA